MIIINVISNKPYIHPDVAVASPKHMSIRLTHLPMSTRGSHVVTPDSAVARPFYVVVDQTTMSSGENCLDLNSGDIFLVTKFNKIGYWWGVCVYDLNRQGWFPSTFVQPYSGEVPEEASELCARLKANVASVPEAEPVGMSETKEPVKFNIVTADDGKFEEYEVKASITKTGRRTNVTEGAGQVAERSDDEEAFDYDSWAESKQLHSIHDSKRRKT